jgi:predicted metalloprotease
MSRPPATVYSQPITTACGDADTHDVFYCGGDQRIYYATDLPEIFRSTSPEVVRNPFFLGNVIGHEYGHAVQARTGILISQVYLRQQAEKERDLELSRRKEMQADCLAGTFLNAVAQASQMTGVERTALWEVSYAVGDDIINADPTYVGDHGSGAGRRDWFEIGLASDQVNVCNTWTAPAGQVR